MSVRKKITALAVGTITATCGVPAAASGAEPGFTVDPQSPAGVEYQVPLDSARGQGGGGTGHHGGGGGLGGTGGGGQNGGSGTGGPSSSSGAPPLFGAGITPASGGASSSGSGGGRNGGSGVAGRAAGGSGSSSKQPSPALTTAADYSSTGPVAGIVAAILLAGGGLGLFVRLRGRRPRRIFS